MRTGRALIGGAAAAIGLATALGVVFIRPHAWAEGPGSVPLIKAETTPIKVKPKDPGGLKIPHKDKSIYERLENPRKVVPASGPGKDAKKPRQTASAKPGSKELAQELGPYRVQLGSFSSTESAQRRWRQLRARHSDLVGSLQMVLERVEIRARGTAVRLQAGPLKSAGDVKKLCQALAKRKVGCFLVKG